MTTRGRRLPAPFFFIEEIPMDDKQLQKLIRKNVEGLSQGKKKPSPKQYDSTLTRNETEGDVDRDKFFDEMKRREF